MTEYQKREQAAAKARNKARRNKTTYLEKLYMHEGKLTPRWKIRIEQMEDMTPKKRRREKLKLQRLGYLLVKKRVKSELTSE